MGSGIEGTSILGLRKPQLSDELHMTNRQIDFSLQQIDNKWTLETPTPVAFADTADANPTDTYNVARADHRHGAPATPTTSARITGEIRMWPVVTPPTGFLLCNGAAVSRSTYAALFAVVSTVFGVGDGSTTFNVPDYRDRSPIGAGTTYSVGTNAGALTADISHLHTGPNHAHSGPDHAHTIDHGHTASTGVESSTETVDDTGSGVAANNNHTHVVTVVSHSGSSGNGGTGSTGNAGTGNTGSGGSAAQSLLHPVIPIYFVMAT